MGCCASGIKPHSFDVFTHPPEDVARPADGLRVLLIVNPFSGGKRGLEYEAKARAFLEAQGCTVTALRTERAGHAVELAADADSATYDVVAPIGGDGTVHETVNGMLRAVMMGQRTLADIPALAPLPCGTGNTFAYDLGLLGLDDALANLVAFTVRRVDVLEVSDPSDTSFTSLSYTPPEAVVGEEKASDDGEEEGGGDEESKTAGTGLVSAVASAVVTAAEEVASEADAVAADAATADAADGSGDGADTVAAEAVAAEAVAAEAAATAVAADVTDAAVSPDTSEQKTQSNAEPAAAVSADDVAPTVPCTPPAVTFAINIVGFGLPSAVLRRANALRWCGGAKYNCAAYGEMCSLPQYPVLIEIPGGDDVVAQPYSMVQAQLTVHMGEKMPFCPRARLDDGLMDVCNIKHSGRMAAVKAMEGAKKGAHVTQNTVDYVQLQEMVMRPVNASQAGDATVNIDGENTGRSPCRVRCLARVLRVVAPASTSAPEAAAAATAAGAGTSGEGATPVA